MLMLTVQINEQSLTMLLERVKKECKCKDYIVLMSLIFYIINQLQIVIIFKMIIVKIN